MPNSQRKIPRCPEFNSTYPKGCRCRFCTDVNTRRRTEERLRYLARQRGVVSPTDRLPVEEARELVCRAFSNGASDTEIARLTGLRKVAIQKLRLGRTSYITRDSNTRIIRALADNEDIRAFSPYSRVPADWTRQMIYGLCAQGWSMKHQRQLLRDNKGIDGGFMQSVTSGNYPNVYYKHQQAMYWLVNQIDDATGPSTRTAKWAAREGHLPVRFYDYKGNRKRTRAKATK